MLAAENYSNAIKLDGEWTFVTVEPAHVLALRAQIKELESRRSRGGGRGGGDRNKESPTAPSD
jgi:hypothetical protein